MRRLSPDDANEGQNVVARKSCELVCVLATRIASSVHVNLDRVPTSRGSEKYAEVLEFRVSVGENAEQVRGDQSLMPARISSFGFSFWSLCKAAWEARYCFFCKAASGAVR